MKLTDEQQDALRKVVDAKLALWDAADAAEKVLGFDIDSGGDELDGFCAMIDGAEDLDHDDLIEAFGLDE